MRRMAAWAPLTFQRLSNMAVPSSIQGGGRGRGSVYVMEYILIISLWKIWRTCLVCLMQFYIWHSDSIESRNSERREG